MYCRVTIGTGPVQKHDISIVGSNLTWNDLMTLLHMTRNTKQRHSESQQPLLPGAVAHVTVTASFLNRGMLPKKRSSLFLMAAKAKSICVSCFKQVFTTAAVGVVTRTALHARSAVLIPDQVCRAKSHGVACCFVTATTALKLARANETNGSLRPAML